MITFLKFTLEFLGVGLLIWGFCNEQKFINFEKFLKILIKNTVKEFTK